MSTTVTKRANPLPAGTFEVAASLIVAGVTGYAFLIIADHALGEDAVAPLTAIWGVLFTAAPGFFLPLEQEVSRAVAGRRARELGAGPLIRRAASLGAILLAFLVVVSLIVSPVITDRLFKGQWLLYAALMSGLFSYAIGHLLRGVLSGRGHFRAYGVYLGAEAVVRMLICAGCALVGVRTAGLYGLAIGLAPLAAAALVVRDAQPHFHEPGPPAPWNELTPSFGALLAASVFSAALMNAAIIGANLLKSDGQDVEVKKVFNGVIVARIPLFLFQAIQAALLPKLAALASARRFGELRHSLVRLVEAVAAVGVLGTVGGYVFGPLAVRTAFKNVELGHLDVGILAGGTGFFMVATSLAQALIALGSQGRVAIAWMIGLLSFAAVAAVGDDLLFRLELASLVASAVSCVAMAWFLVRRLHEAEHEAAQHEDHGAGHQVHG